MLFCVTLKMLENVSGIKLLHYSTVCLSLHEYTISRLQLMGRQEDCVQQEVTAPQLLPLPFPVPPAPSATALASAGLRIVSAVHQGNITHTTHRSSMSCDYFDISLFI